MESRSQPKRLNLYHHAKDTFTKTFTVVNSNGTNFDFTGYTLDAAIVIGYDSSQKVSFTTSLTAGEFTLTLPVATVLSLGESEYKWYCRFTNGSGQVKTWFSGYYVQDFKNEDAENNETTSIIISDETITVTISNEVGNNIGWSYGTNAQMATKDAELTAAGALAGSYMFFNTDSNSPYFWNGSNFV